MESLLTRYSRQEQKWATRMILESIKTNFIKLGYLILIWKWSSSLFVILIAYFKRMNIRNWKYLLMLRRETIVPISVNKTFFLYSWNITFRSITTAPLMYTPLFKVIAVSIRKTPIRICWISPPFELVKSQLKSKLKHRGIAKNTTV